jgi:GTPase involved in cell partitioning and DNA repair
MGTYKKEISEKDQVILENKMEKNKLEDQIKKLKQTKEMFQQ